jgi:hypothetical protein
MKLLIAMAILSLTTLSGRAQSLLEDLFLESANAASILQEQTGDDVSMNNVLAGWNTFLNSSNDPAIQASIALNAAQNQQAGTILASDEIGISLTESDHQNLLTITALPEPSSVWLIGIGWSILTVYKRRALLSRDEVEHGN